LFLGLIAFASACVSPLNRVCTPRGVRIPVTAVKGRRPRPLDDGGSSPPEGYRVAVGRYGLPVQKRAAPVRRTRIAGLVVTALGLVLVLAACGKASGSAKSTKASTPSACTYVAKLDTIAATVANADVHQPEEFKKTLDTAVHDYVANVRELRAVAPADLRGGLERVEADVQQYRFDAALTDRAALDSYAARTCHRAEQPLTPASGPAATVGPGSTATTSVPLAG
jgi:hypothetical protein